MNDAPLSRYESSLETYSVKVSGRWTTVRLESELMAALKDVALAKGSNQPVYNDFKLDTLRAVGFDANIHLMDVEATNPDEYRIIRLAPITILHRATDNVPLKSLGDTLYAREIRADYSAAKFKGKPVLQQ